jgi:uncharacterized membrane protein YuzA (DUF378 family)
MKKKLTLVILYIAGLFYLLIRYMGFMLTASPLAMILTSYIMILIGFASLYALYWLLEKIE